MFPGPGRANKSWGKIVEDERDEEQVRVRFSKREHYILGRLV